MWCPIANGYGFGTRAVMKSHQILTINSSPPRGTFAWKRIQKDFFIVSLFHRFLFACVKIFGCFLSASETLESRVFTSSKGSIGGTTQSLLGLHDSKKIITTVIYHGTEIWTMFLGFYEIYRHHVMFSRRNRFLYFGIVELCNTEFLLVPCTSSSDHSQLLLLENYVSIHLFAIDRVQ